MRSPDMFSLETANMNGNYFVFKEKCVDPPGEVRARGWVWVQLAKRLGIADQCAPRLANVPDDKWDEAIDNLHVKLTRNGCCGKKLPH